MKFIITEEQNDKLNQKVKSVVNKYGLERAIELFDNNDIIRRTYQDNPSSFLNQFNDLIPVEKGGITYYVDKDRLPLFYYYGGYMFINYVRIWSFFSEVIGLEYTEIKDIIKNWLEGTYELTAPLEMYPSERNTPII